MQKQGRLRVDLHVHTRYSKDSRESPEDMVRKAISIGLDAIAIADHNTTAGIPEAEKAAGGRLIIIPGQEVRTLGGEVLVLGLRESLPQGMPAIETMKCARRMGGFVIVPHPFDIMRNGLGKSLSLCAKYIDAVEVFNARTIFGMFNNKALQFAESHNLPMSAGSDSHFSGEMGGCFMLVDSARSASAILEAVRLGKAELVIRNRGKPAGLKRGLMKLRTYF